MLFAGDGNDFSCFKQSTDICEHTIRYDIPAGIKIISEELLKLCFRLVKLLLVS